MIDTPGPPALVIFDCDGVLVDSERLVQEVDQRLIAELGWTITVEAILDQHLGRSEAAVLANIARRTGPVPADFPARRRAQFERAFQERLETVHGIEQVLDALDSWRVPAC